MSARHEIHANNPFSVHNVQEILPAVCIYLYENNKHYTRNSVHDIHYLGLLYPTTHCDNGLLLSALEFKFIFHCATGLYRNNQR